MTLFPLHFFIFYSKTPVHRLSLLFSQTELKLLRWDNKYLGAEFYSCAAKTVLFMIPCRKKETTNIKYFHILGVFAYKKLLTRAKLHFEQHWIKIFHYKIPPPPPQEKNIFMKTLQICPSARKSNIRSKIIS